MRALSEVVLGWYELNRLPMVQFPLGFSGKKGYTSTFHPLYLMERQYELYRLKGLIF